MFENKETERVEKLLSFALSSGASRSASLPAERLKVENHLSELCRTPQCPNYAKSMSCPPHVAGPDNMRKLLARCRHAVVIRLEVDTASLTGDDKTVVFRLLHEVVAGVEAEARRLGFQLARGYAGGSCKQIFCSAQHTCRVVEEKKPCRHPDQARPSMSGFGINVGELMKSCGWSSRIYTGTEADGPMSWLAGLILLGSSGNSLSASLPPRSVTADS